MADILTIKNIITEKIGKPVVLKAPNPSNDKAVALTVEFINKAFEANSGILIYGDGDALFELAEAFGEMNRRRFEESQTKAFYLWPSTEECQKFVYFNYTESPENISRSLETYSQLHDCPICGRDDRVGYYCCSACGYIFCQPCKSEIASRSNLYLEMRDGSTIDVFRCPHCRELQNS